MLFNFLCGRRSICRCLFKLQGKVTNKHNTLIITLHADKCMLECKQWRQQYNKIEDQRPKCFQVIIIVLLGGMCLMCQENYL